VNHSSPERPHSFAIDHNGTPNSSATDRLRALADSRELRGKPWQPEVGDELVGVFRGWSSGVTKRAERHPIAIVEDASGTSWAVWLFYRVLRAEFQEANPEPGELVLVRRLPDREGPNGAYRVFRVAVDRAAADPFADTDSPVDCDEPGDWGLAKGRGDSPDNLNWRDTDAALPFGKGGVR
jgi:hypothetical protein